MSAVIMLLCTVAGYTLAQPIITAVRNAQAARHLRAARKAQGLSALRHYAAAVRANGAKGR